MKSPTPGVSISLLPRFHGSAAAEIDKRFEQVGDDDNWEVREWTASALSHVIGGHFDLVTPRLREWAVHPSPNVRRMVVVATGYAMRDCAEQQSQQLLDLLTPLMSDDDAYVSKNLGPFALGSYAIRYQTALVATWGHGLDLDNAQAAWNLAMMFTTEGAKKVLSFQVLLSSLVRDGRRPIQGAVLKALRNIAKRNEPALTVMLAAWEASPATCDAASRARIVLGATPSR